MTVKVTIRIKRTINDCVRYLVLAHSRDIMIACTLSKVRLISFLGSMIVAIQSRICIKLITRQLSCVYIVRLALVGVHVIH